ncbi:MAG TPA: ABATE domain-containing protein [Alphaproteobacteria bacterium]|nr:ABATE domain-containing protein [Alphaproteobacteria bacterium]
MPSISSALKSEDKAPQAGQLALVGGVLCLDFTNTVSGLHEGEHEREHLRSYDNLLAWATHAGALDVNQARMLSRRSRDDPNAAMRAFHRALTLREAIHDVFAAIAGKADVPRRMIEVINGALSETLRHACIISHGQQFAWGWDDLTGRLDAPLWPVLRSAAEMLTEGKLDRVKQCPYPHCGWLFVDFSKNKSRRWCEMSVCGNRTKARRHYMREKEANS